MIIMMSNNFLCKYRMYVSYLTTVAYDYHPTH